VGDGAQRTQTMKKGAFNRAAKAQFRARELRSQMSVSEQVLWNMLRKDRAGFHFRRQVRVDCYFLDFYCARAKLCVEVDGEQHANQRVHDSVRDQTLRRLGIETLRIPSLELFEENGLKGAEWVDKIQALCEARAGSISTPQPPSSLTNQSEEWGS
jgi:very-short-patch-repair endonuclease